MESGFRKLWSRKKSFGSTDHSGHQRNISTSTGLSTKSTNASAVRDGRPSFASSLPFADRPYSRDRLGTSRDFLSRPSADEHLRPKTGHRIQPMLVGISRPQTENDRPDTPGSFQNAVLKAGELSDRSPSHVPIPAKNPARMQAEPVMKQRSKMSRHVDIFSATKSKHSDMAGYNEEVAERNLDMYRLVLESTPYVYDPSSKYQEEVAIRNAVLPYKVRSSTDTTRRSADRERTGSLTNKSVRNITSPTSNATHSHQSSVDLVPAGLKLSNDQRSNHSRQPSQRSRDVPLPPTLQEEPVEEYNAQGEDVYVHLSNHVPPRTAPNGTLRDIRMQTITEGQPYQTQPTDRTRSTTPRESAAPSTKAVSEHRSIPVDYGQPLQPSSTNRSIHSDRSIDARLNNDTALGPPSAQSTASSFRGRIVLPNRMIMDLTSDETSETSSTYQYSQYSQYSPILELAQSDAFQRILPSQIHTEERRISKVVELPKPEEEEDLEQTQEVVEVENTEDVITPTLKSPAASEPEKKLALPNTFAPVDTVASPKTEEQPAISSPLISVNTVALQAPEKKPALSSTFSPINTVASWSPRSSAYVADSFEPKSMKERVAAALEASKAITKGNPLPLSNTRGDETPTVKERVKTLEKGATAPASAVEAPINSSPKVAQPTRTSADLAAHIPTDVPANVSSKPLAKSVSNESAKMDPITKPAQSSPAQQRIESASLPTVDSVMKTPTKAVRPVARNEPQGTPASNTKGKSTEASSIYTSPASITSVDYTNPSSAFGVRTRDFALTPQKSAPSLKKAQSQKAAGKSVPAPTANKTEVRSKSAKPRVKQNSSATRQPIKDAGFDEEAFARKQAEARAALERLKESLSENFLSLPDRETVKSRAGTASDTDGGPVAPTMMVQMEMKPNASLTLSQRIESEKAPPSSFRNSRGTDPQRSSLASTSRSLSAGSRSSRRAGPPSQLKNVEAATNPIDQKMLSPALLQALQMTSAPPRSPGEISLSSFPVPSSSRPPSQPDVPTGFHSHTNSMASAMKRRNSTRSQTSTTSAFSIPYHMVPGRSSSVRDPVPEEGDWV